MAGLYNDNDGNRIPLMCIFLNNLTEIRQIAHIKTDKMKYTGNSIFVPHNEAKKFKLNISRNEKTK